MTPTSTERATVGGLIRTWFAWCPAGWAPSDGAILALHPGGHATEQPGASWVAQKCAAYLGGPHAVIAPQSLRRPSSEEHWRSPADGGWGVTGYPGQDLDLVLHLVERYGLDPGRTVVTGQSSGAHLAWSLLMRRGMPLWGLVAPTGYPLHIGEDAGQPTPGSRVYYQIGALDHRASRHAPALDWDAMVAWLGEEIVPLAVRRRIEVGDDQVVERTSWSPGQAPLVVARRVVGEGHEMRPWTPSEILAHARALGVLPEATA